MYCRPVRRKDTKVTETGSSRRPSLPCVVTGSDESVGGGGSWSVPEGPRIRGVSGSPPDDEPPPPTGRQRRAYRDENAPRRRWSRDTFGSRWKDPGDGLSLNDPRGPLLTSQTKDTGRRRGPEPSRKHWDPVSTNFTTFTQRRLNREKRVGKRFGGEEREETGSVGREEDPSEGPTSFTATDATPGHGDQIEEPTSA